MPNFANIILTVDLPETFYAAEITVIKGITEIHDIQKREVKDYEKCMGECGLNGLLGSFVKTITKIIGKRRLKFKNGHLCRMNDYKIKTNFKYHCTK